MCTALSYPGKRHYFGRNLDLEYSFHEEVVVTQRNYPFHFRCGITLQNHHAMIGIATVSENYPLYYESTNEFGLSIAALNFPGNAVYQCEKEDMHNITPFELIPWVLGQCKNVQEAKQILKKEGLTPLAKAKVAELEKIEISEEDIENEYQQICTDYNVEIDYAKSALPSEEIVHSLTMRRAVEAVKSAAKITYLDKAPEEPETSEDAE